MSLFTSLAFSVIRRKHAEKGVYKHCQTAQFLYGRWIFIFDEREWNNFNFM